MIKIIIFDDNAARREGLNLLLSAIEEMTCIGTYSDCRDIAQILNRNKPDVILMDINMPHVDGIEGLKISKSLHPDIKVIMQTIFEEETKILAAISNGADGYILKQKSPMKLIDGINEVMAGGAPMTPTVAKKVLKLFSSLKSTKQNKEIELTKREHEILTLLVEGYSYKMIADKIHISYATVNKHVSNTYKKLQVNSVAAAVSKAIKLGIV
ncbi:MAG: response regulator transcription factor [Saprospiraceae bacterium]|nr:response regulator transcription factor [Saprospiraceae bacterium]